MKKRGLKYINAPIAVTGYKRNGGTRKLPKNYFRQLIQPLVRVAKKVYRNETCPCGSGLKYKKCCINK